MKMVIDSYRLRSGELRAYLARSRSNFLSSLMPRPDVSGHRENYRPVELKWMP